MPLRFTALCVINKGHKLDSFSDGMAAKLCLWFTASLEKKGPLATLSNSTFLHSFPLGVAMLTLKQYLAGAAWKPGFRWGFAHHHFSQQPWGTTKKPLNILSLTFNSQKVRIVQGVREFRIRLARVWLEYWSLWDTLWASNLFPYWRVPDDPMVLINNIKGINLSKSDHC